MTRMINDVNDETLYYDYAHQAWVQDGVYISCNHPAWMTCDCYGTLHAGEKAPLR